MLKCYLYIFKEGEMVSLSFDKWLHDNFLCFQFHIHLREKLEGTNCRRKVTSLMFDSSKQYSW